jgi:hypothetical protein
MSDAGIAVNATVAQKRPVAPDIFQMFQIALADEDFFFIVRGFHDDPSQWIAKKRSAPEFQALALSAVAIDIAELMPYSIDHGYKNPVGDGVRSLDGAPGIVLDGAKLGLFVGMPADRGGIEQNIRTL